MNLQAFARVLDEISDERVPQDLNLLPGILVKVQKESQPVKKTTPKLRLATALLLILVLLIALFSLPGVASALKKLIGYLPGIGTVEQDASLRVLASPVTDTRDGYTITVESAVIDPTRTVISYRISGQFQVWDDPSLQPRMCEQPPILRLADGRELVYPSRVGGSGGNEVRWRDTFPAVPAADQQATLVLPCLSDLPAGDGPQNWEIPLVFAPAPPDMTVFPVVELPTASPTAPLPAVEHTATRPASTAEPGLAGEMQLSLQSFAALNDGYYLQAMLGWKDMPSAYEVQIYPNAVHLLDSAGQDVAVSLTDQTPPFAPAEAKSMPLNLQTAPVLSPGPVKLVVDYVGVSKAAAASFTFEVGDDPQPGQTWELNKDLDINGYGLRVVSAEYIRPQPGEPPWLMLYLSSDSGILSVTAMDTQHEILGTGGSPGSAQVPFRAGWRYKDGFPKGMITVDVTNITVRYTGPWAATWTPPAGTATPTIQAAAMPQEKGICLDETSSPAGPVDLPEGLGGRLAFSNENYDMTVANLDGSSAIAAGNGVFPDLSRDGKWVAFRKPEGGIFVRDVAGGDENLISGPIQENISDIWPKWSPDGQQIAFIRVKDHLSDVYLVNADGSNLHPILSGPEDESLIGWAPDGRSISYSVTIAEGMSLRVLDLQTGRSFEAAQLPAKAVQMNLSPDGKRLVYTNDRGMFLAPLDGSAPVLLLASPLQMGGPVWSPDGQWIALNYWAADASTKPRLALLQPDTCRFIQLGEQKGGWLWSWVQ